MSPTSLPRVLILDTGGTISQKPGHEGALEPCSTDYIETVPRLHDAADIRLIRLQRMDSTDMTTSLRGEIARQICDNYDDYDGFVVLHGTGTMPETASALTYMLRGLGKPVVLTGAQLPIFAPGPDGMNNLYYSVIAATLDLGEVVICFGDRILRGSRSTKENVHGFNAFVSTRIPPLGELGVTVRLLDHRLRRTGSRPQLFTSFNPRVCYLPLTSGSELPLLEMLAASGTPDGVVLGGFGTGNIPSLHMKGLKALLARDIPVIVVTTCLRGDTILEQYRLGQIVRQAGAEEGLDLTPGAACQKLMFALGKTDEDCPALTGPERVERIYSLFRTPVAMDMEAPSPVS